MNSLLIVLRLILVLICYSTNHPILITALVIILSLTTRLMASQLTHFWILLALILIFLGGVIILFVYITTLANNEKLVLPSTSKSRLLLAAPLRIIRITWLSNNSALTLLPTLGAYFNPVSGRNLILLTAYLLLALSRVVKLRQSNRGALNAWS